VRRIERILIRTMILASVLLVVVQLGLAQDPVDFYLATAAKIESPPLDIPTLDNSEITTGRIYAVLFKAAPKAPVKIWQDGILLGDLSQGEKLVKVSAGEVILDGRGLEPVIRIQIVPQDARLQEPRARVVTLKGNSVSFKVNP